jgi:hypothetical protein
MNGHTPQHSTGKYNLATAAAVCTVIESVVSKWGHHTALTGGCLYGEGGRKDIDIVIYRRRDLSLEDMKANMPKMLKVMQKFCEMKLVADHGFVKKFKMGDIPIDTLWPEEIYGDYPLDAIADGDKHSKQNIKTNIADAIRS